ncbi:rod shape-determining protein RodA [Telmatospirillum sp. J64-1]|uniref:rod shape-determining protein RodA n=1 Tax=Telmatospirillum sp. J64-1 TaxID=2502183 RepID=UPI00115ED813|nr:rod shape-determining protein RodA [Telmatospirillum sp. J64-1]
MLSRVFTTIRNLKGPDWAFLFLTAFLAAAGSAALYSAASGNLLPWAWPHILRYGFGVLLAGLLTLIDLRLLLRHAYSLYAVVLALLVVVEVMGHVGMGAQRWINLGIITLQPSELMKIALVLALARYFHSLPSTEGGRLHRLLVPLLLTAVPTVLVFMQPNLGNTLLLGAIAVAIFFAAGIPSWIFGMGAAAIAAAVPIVWASLHAYQKRRVMTFLDPTSDPLGAGYNINQSLIAFGSGGWSGRGFLEGTQGRLGFLPERHTDFIFVILGEEFGFIGALFVLLAYMGLVLYGYAVAFRSRHTFGRLIAVGLATSLFLYLFINTAMVMGLIPVVGIPLPLVSYGGTAMLTVMLAAGLMLNVSLNPRLGREG